MDRSRIGKYEVEERIGAGGFGVVYRARDPHLKRLVALKVCSSADPETVQRFFREAQLAASLQHPNITTVYDSGVEEGTPFFAQEFLSGRDLDEILRTTPPSLIEALRILIQVSNGLAYAHSRDIIHRDIKPANIRLLDDGSAKLMDFGIAKLVSSDSQLTRAGESFGTVGYLAPEQVRGDQTGPWTDVFSLGAVAYELVTGKRPFAGEEVGNVLHKVLHETPEPPRQLNPHCPRPVDEAIMAALGKAPHDRIDSVHAFALALQQGYQELTTSRIPFVEFFDPARQGTGVPWQTTVRSLLPALAVVTAGIGLLVVGISVLRSNEGTSRFDSARREGHAEAQSGSPLISAQPRTVTTRTAPEVTVSGRVTGANNTDVSTDPPHSTGGSIIHSPRPGPAPPPPTPTVTPVVVEFRLSVEPPSTVFINDRSLGEVRTTTLRLAPGEYRFRQVIQSYKEQSKTVKITEETQEVQLELPPFAEVTVLNKSGVPVVGTRVRIDGKDVGPLPLRGVRTPFGSHEIEVRWPNGRVTRRSLDIASPDAIVITVAPGG